MLNWIRILIYKLINAYSRICSRLSGTVASSHDRRGKKILIACSHFWPSVGGLENRVEQFGSELVKVGYEVTVITPEVPGRVTDVRHGIKIQSINRSEKRLVVLAWPQAVCASVVSGDYHACILIQDPLGEILWSMEKISVPAQTRLLVQPIINAEGYATWRDSARFCKRLAGILKNASAAVAMTRNGHDVHFMLNSGIAPVCIPNATTLPKPASGFRQQYGIAEDSFVVLHVANLWWVKNHAGLVEALSDLPPSWKLVLIGNPTTELDCASSLTRILAQRPEILYIPGLNRDAVSAAMEESNVIVLSSRGEGSPNTILEAMAHRRPWLATPQCGAALDNAGGIICPVSEFKEYLAVLQANPVLCRYLGELGYQHWESCCSWPMVTQGWIDLIETGRLQRNFVMPAEIATKMKRLRTFVASVIDTNTSFSSHEGADTPWQVESPQQQTPGAWVNIGMITYNRLEFTRQVIDALQAVTAGAPFVLTVVDNASSDGTRQYLQELKDKGIIGNLVLLDANVGVAKASNLAWSLVPDAPYYLKLDNDIVIHKAGWIVKMIEVCEAIPEAGAVGYNFEPTRYPVVSLHGVQVRPKMTENLGGACIMIPRRIHERLGFWCEDYGFYGEEDADYCARVRNAGFFNIYMEDEEVGFHLPSGRAAKIGLLKRARDGVEEFTHAEYRAWKDKARRSNARKFKENVSRYLNQGSSLYVGSDFVEQWKVTAGAAGSSLDLIT